MSAPHSSPASSTERSMLTVFTPPNPGNLFSALPLPPRQAAAQPSPRAILYLTFPMSSPTSFPPGSPALGKTGSLVPSGGHGLLPPCLWPDRSSRPPAEVQVLGGLESRAVVQQSDNTSNQWAESLPGVQSTTLSIHPIFFFSVGELRPREGR